MSRYPPPDFRGSRDRSRSPPRFSDRRPSAASVFDNRPQGPPRTTSDLPRAPRATFDGPRPPPSGSPGPPGAGARPVYTSLRDAPPLGSADRGRTYRDREYDRRDRPSSPRDRSPPRAFKDLRDFPSRESDLVRDRRESRDASIPVASTYVDGPAFSGQAPARGNFTRGRGRGDFPSRGGRGGRINLDERDLFRRERSPPPRWGRDLSRDSRDSDRRDDRRFERREDERRPPEWLNREREREPDRGRRDPVPQRPDARPSPESMPAGSGLYQAPQAPHVNPARLALIESTGADVSVRRSSVQLDSAGPREARRDQPETPAYLNGRAETTANRYGSRGSSPPTQAPPVPAFTLSFAPPTSASATSPQSVPTMQPAKASQESKSPIPATVENSNDESNLVGDQGSGPPLQAPTAPKMPPAAPKAQLVSPPPAAAPRAPRALELEEAAASGNRFRDARSTEDRMDSGATLSAPIASRAPASAALDCSTSATSTNPSLLPTLVQPIQPVAPIVLQSSRLSDIIPPTGPRASRISPAQGPVSPRPPLASPRSDAGAIPGLPRMQTPPPSAPSGPRNRAYSTSPKVASSSIPTAPKASRAPALGFRVSDRGPLQTNRVPDRLGASPAWAPPSAPRNLPQWNQWRRPGAPMYGEKTVPAKRDLLGDEKSRPADQVTTFTTPQPLNKSGDRVLVSPKPEIAPINPRRTESVGSEQQSLKRQSTMMGGHSAARSFFGQPTEGEDEESGTSDNAQELPSTSDEDESDLENDLALFNAKFERQKRILEAQMIDLSTRQYRATTPLENLARLARISTQDLQRFNEQRDHAMDLDKSPVVRKQHALPLTRHSSDSAEGPDVHTPKEAEDHRVRIHSSDDSSDSKRRVRLPTPEPVNLPYLLQNSISPYGEDDAFTEWENLNNAKTIVLDALEEGIHFEQDDAEETEDHFALEFRQWREECEDLDRVKEEQEKLERQHSLEPKPEIDPTSSAPMNPTVEGRRLYKFSSEYEMEQVLKQSEETARIDQERQERETRKNQADMEKEAIISNQFSKEERLQSVFIDTNRYRDPERLSLVFTYEPAADNFTENEQHIFIAAFKETPKKWGEIASLLPNRTYQDCIRHYYTNKWDGRFRDNRARKYKVHGRRGRGGARGPRGRVGGLMADLARAEDLLTTENMSEKGRPRRAAAPTTFAEKEAEAKATLLGPSPAKKAGSASKTDSNGEIITDKPGKRQKRTGEKPGRKSNKSAHPLAALAAAPHGSPPKQFLHGMPSKEGLADATLLASLHNGPHSAMNPEPHTVYHQEGYTHHMMHAAEDTEQRVKVASQGPAAKPGASSYWSVPEQQDFVKYIGHFGRDFGAIAAHMGTKTQTMIKNHYQRQVDGGNRPDLERAAMEADERRARGEDIGPPPTPTPIQKRKYENPPISAQRNIAPHAENAELEDNGPPQRLGTAKHASPPQYVPQPRFTTSGPTSSIAAPRAAPSPLSTAATPIASLPATSQSRSMQNPLGTRMTFLSETRPENVPGYRPPQESQGRNYLPQQTRPIQETQGSQYMRNLLEQQDQALRQERINHPERAEQFQMHPSVPRESSHRSPLTQPSHHAPDRKPALDDRPSSPPRSLFPPSGTGRPLFGSSNFAPQSASSLSSLTGRSAFNHTPLKREDPRMASVASTPVPTQPAPPAEPKRSNVLSLLNSDEGPKPIKRDSYPSATPNAASPLRQGFPNAVSEAAAASRREHAFGQPSIPQSQFRRESFSAQSTTPTPMAPNLKHEPSASHDVVPQGRKLDWPNRMLSQPMQSSPPPPAIDRDGRSLYQHRSVLGPLGQSRMNPSPPPMSGNPHSRTPSLSGAAGQQQREHMRAALPSHQHPQSQQAIPSLHPNPYASQPQPTGPSQNHSHHAHNSSLGGPFPTFHQRSVSRDDYGKPDRSLLAQREREREEHEIMRLRQQEAIEAERRREEQYRHQDQQERERHQAYQRTPLQPQHAPTFGGMGFGGSRIGDLRSQSRIDAAEMARRDEQERMRLQQDAERRKQDSIFREREQADEVARRRQHEDPLMRRTPLGGPFGVPPPPASRR